MTDQTSLALRNLKVAAVWGVQILLYPFYLLTQASLTVAHQLSSQADIEETRRRGDGEIRRRGEKEDKEDKETRKIFPIPHSQTTNNKQPTTNNQQQTTLPLAPRPLIGLIQPHLLPPARLFWRLMAWIQTSPVAIAANLFEESKLSCSVTILPEQAQLPQVQFPGNSQLPKALAFLDHTTAELEAHQLVPPTEVAIILRESSSQLFHKLQKQLRTLEDSTASPEEPQTLKARIQALIYAALEYFFGKSGSHLPWTITLQQLSTSANPSGDPTTSLPPVGKSPNPVLPDTVAPNPWLTLEDLFCNKAEPTPSQEEPTPNPSQEEPTPNPSQEGDWRFQGKEEGCKVESSPSGKNLPPGDESRFFLASYSRVTDNNLEPAVDWIDTDASSTGYVKHPLEQILDWVDSTMLKFEEFALKIWRWLWQRGDG
ncbi:MAG: hypothetical protein F6K47_02285 [Symploca sp. SIO2E6]|nr:hypothetical protein [Symploca sp. SIO2E6]